MIKKLLPLILILFSVNAFAGQCKIKSIDLTKALQSAYKTNVLKTDIITPMAGNATIYRYVVQLPDGIILVIEQKHCVMYDNTITALIPEGASTTRLPKIMAKAIEETSLWKKCFSSSNAEKLLKKEFSSKRFLSIKDKIVDRTYSMDDLFFCSDDNSETLIRINNLSPEFLPFKSIISIYFGVGGE